MRRTPLALAAILALGSPPAPASAQVATELPTLEVEGQAVRERGDGPVQGYRATRTTSATRTDTPIREIPQSVTVVPRQVAEDTAATRVEDLLTYAGGVVRQNNLGGLALREVAIRGFATGEFYRNGFSINRGYQSPPDAASIERVEVLRGPASLLYGRGDPGGTFNIITQQPLPFASYGATGFFDHRGSARGTFDATGPLNREGTVAYRLGGAVENTRSFREFVEGDRLFLAPVLTWRATPDTTVTLEAELLRSDQTLDRGVVAVGNRLGAVPIRRFLGEPNQGRLRTENAVVQLRAEHRLNNDWTARVGGQYLGGSLVGDAIENNRLLADGRTLRRERRFRDYEWGDLDLQANVTGRFATGPLQHTLIAGLEYETYRNREILFRSNVNATPYTIDIFAPAYGRPPPPLASRSTDTLEKIHTYAAFVQDQVAITPKLKAVAGVRVERFEQEFASRTGGGLTTEQAKTAAVPRVGLLYDLTGSVSVYGSVARSFRPNRGGDVAGRPFAPENGMAYEVGAKFDLLDGRLGVTAAVFQIERENVLTPDPANTAFSIVAAEARSRGFDVTVAGELAPSWRVIGGYAYVDAETTRGNAALPAGSALLNIPRHSASLLSVYEFRDGPLAGLGVGGGVNHVGSRAGQADNPAFRLPSYTTVDALAYYRITKNVRVNLNVLNLFDKEYYERSFSNVFVSPGAPRTVFGSVAFRF